MNEMWSKFLSFKTNSFPHAKALIDILVYFHEHKIPYGLSRQTLCEGIEVYHLRYELLNPLFNSNWAKQNQEILDIYNKAKNVIGKVERVSATKDGFEIKARMTEDGAKAVEQLFEMPTPKGGAVYPLGKMSRCHLEGLKKKLSDQMDDLEDEIDAIDRVLNILEKEDTCESK